jgi:hypothetical protein
MKKNEVSRACPATHFFHKYLLLVVFLELSHGVTNLNQTSLG